MREIVLFGDRRLLRCGTFGVVEAVVKEYSYDVNEPNKPTERKIISYDCRFSLSNREGDRLSLSLAFLPSDDQDENKKINNFIDDLDVIRVTVENLQKQILLLVTKEEEKK